MPRNPSSRAVIKAARLNPINREEAKALAYIQKLEGEGYNFKEIVVDAINRAQGLTPEMFTREVADESNRFAGLVEQILARFASELLSHIKTGQVHVSQNVDEDAQRDDGMTAFAKNFSRGLLQRQQMIRGGEDDE